MRQEVQEQTQEMHAPLVTRRRNAGKTSTEECLARYVCCIDDYCCGEPECIETGACETDLHARSTGLLLRGKNLRSLSAKA